MLPSNIVTLCENYKSKNTIKNSITGLVKLKFNFIIFYMISNQI